MEGKIRLGVSSCLLGNEVRHNGSHARDRYVTDVLGRYFEYVPVCPEVEAGFPVPREAFRLVGDPEDPRMVVTKTGQDVTGQMKAFCERRARELERENLCGFIFKAKSPSSGMERVKVYDANNVPSTKGVGLFARAFKEHFPLLPVEEDGPVLRIDGLEKHFETGTVLDRLPQRRQTARKLPGIHLHPQALARHRGSRPLAQGPRRLPHRPQDAHPLAQPGDISRDGPSGGGRKES